MFTIKTLNAISPVGLAKLNKNLFDVSVDTDAPDGILVRSADLLNTTFNDNLLAIARAGAGVNNIPLDRCSEQGIVVFNTPGANARSVMELTLCGLLLGSRDVVGGMEWVKSIAGTPDVAKQVEKGKSQFAGPEIKGKTLGIIGLGAIGALVANAAIALGMQVVGTDPFLSVGAALRLNPAVRVVGTREAVFAAADYLTIHVPCNADTKGMINQETIALMKDGVRVLNYARGELVNDDDMLAALASGKVSCYCTDFPNAKTCCAEGVLATPHLGASTPESEDNCASMAAQELMTYLETGNIRNSVNMPNAELDAKGPKICIIHKNIPAMIANITAAIAKAGLNIETTVNASRGDIAYTMLEVGGAVPESVSAELAAVDGVIRVRVIAK